MSRNTLLIMLKNLELGKVKTRLAKDVGGEKALEVYTYLYEQTLDLATRIEQEVYVHFSTYIPENLPSAFHGFLQVDGDLGVKMLAAFVRAKEQGAEKMLIIGGDCASLTKEHIEQAYRALETYDIVFGPSEDGGYYLMGMKDVQEYLFKNKQWSTPSVLENSVGDAREAGLSYYILPTLNDIDYLSDMPEELRQKFGI